MSKETLAQAVAVAQLTLEAAGLSAATARREAALLARWVLGWDEAAWLTRMHEPSPADFPARFQTIIARRARREPVAYITGAKEFYGRSFIVTSDVLIPRPETELIVEEALRLGTRRWALGTGQTDGAPLVVDVGTGSGCLAITLALEWPSARVIATDISAAALDVARRNAQQLGAADRIEFRHGPFLAGVRGPVDLVVSNLPYIAETDRRALSPDVRDFEPATSLFGGPDGLDAFRALVPDAAGVLTPGGWLILEVGNGQSHDVVDVIGTTAGLTVDHVRDDLQEIPRVIVARRTG